MDEELEYWKEKFYSALYEERSNFIQFLLDAGLDVNALNKFGTTMLSYAAESEDLEIIEFLMQKGADANVANTDGSKPLHVATRFARKDVVEFFLNRGIPVDICDNNKSTPLHYISEINYDRQKYQEIFHILVNRGADVNAVNGKGLTPVLVAAEKGCKHIVELLLKLGVNVECPNEEDQWTVLQYACREGWFEVVRTLIEGKFDIDLNSNASIGYAPVIIAAACSHEDIVKLLIESGVDVKCKSGDNNSLLYYVCAGGWLDLVKTLVKMGCDFNGKDCSGGTPLKVAIERGQDDDADEYHSVVAYLIECGADVEDSYNGGGQKLLFDVCEQGWPEVVKSLIKKGYDVNVPNVEGNTPLHIASYLREMESVEHLLNAGADCNVKNNNGATPFSMAIKDFLNLEVNMLFLRMGAYFQTCACVFIRKNSPFNKDVFQNTQVCTLAIMNKFNFVDLRKIYEIPGVSERLPKIEKLKIASQSNVARVIEDSVRYEIETEGYCNVLNVRPLVLKRLCVLTLVDYYKNDSESDYESEFDDIETDYDNESESDDIKTDYDSEGD